jgi:Pentapeptide repeats (8 copies)
MNTNNRGTAERRKLLAELASLYLEETGVFDQLAVSAGLSRKVDFCNRDLREVDFADSDLRGFNFTGSDLRGTRIRLAHALDDTTDLAGAKLDPEDQIWLRSRRIRQRASGGARGRRNAQQQHEPDLPDPWPGLGPYGRDDAARFVGRESEISLLQESVDRHPVTILSGPYGVGKSSLVLAGLIPRLEKTGDWFCCVANMSSRPFESLSKAFPSAK